MATARSLRRFTRLGPGKVLTRLLCFGALAAGSIACVILLGIFVYRFVPPPVSSLMVWRAAEGQGIDYRWVALDDISAALPRAVIASEDTRFCAHRGVDWDAVSLVIEDIVEDGKGTPRGASTIAMQTVKNLFLWPSRSYIRKALEIPLAYTADAVWPKRRLLEIYLNIVEWGPGVYGAQAAARTHFGKPAGRLNGGEAALLAATLPNPIQRRAGRPGPRTRAIAQKILARMRGIRPYMTCLGTP